MRQKGAHNINRPANVDCELPVNGAIFRKFQWAVYAEANIIYYHVDSAEFRNGARRCGLCLGS